MIDEQEFLDRLVPIFLPKLAAGREDYCLIQAPFDQDSPLSAYATIQFMSAVEIGQMWEGPVTDYGQVIRQDVDVTIRINTYGKGAITTARNFQQSLQFPSMVDKMHTVNAVWRGATAVLNLTPLIKTSYQERATFDITLGTTCDSYDTDIVPVEKVPISISTVDSEDPNDAVDRGTVIADPTVPICGQ